MSNGSYFISDLHMFSSRSKWREHQRDILNATTKADTLVLGGDIFDFRWSTLPSIDATISAAIQWLDELVSNSDHCHFHFVLGNHDSNGKFVDRLDALADERFNLHWHKYFVRLGHSMFLHGDVADGEMNQQRLTDTRLQWHGDDSRHPLHHWLYDVAVDLRLHNFVMACTQRPKRVVKRITVYLDDIGHGPESGLRHVYFGHTHAQLTDYEYCGIRFHNGGAPIRGLNFRIVQCRSDGELD